MLRIFLSVSCLLVSFLCPFPGRLGASSVETHLPVKVAIPDSCASLYRAMGLEGEVDYTAFRQAVAGYYKIDARKREVLALIDFSKPSTERRLYVFDMERKKKLFSSVVAHGRNSGGNYATSFSNESGSFKSSLGFYLTESTYQGRNGYSLVLEGLEKGINDHARRRAIVMHGAAYAEPAVARSCGRLGRSLGCPAVPQGTSRAIIDALKGGSVLFIYAAVPDYLSRSTVLRGESGLLACSNTTLRTGRPVSIRQE